MQTAARHSRIQKMMGPGAWSGSGTQERNIMGSIGRGIRLALAAGAVLAALAVHAQPDDGAPGPAERACVGSQCIELVAVPAGSFLMGSPAGEAERSTDEGPQRRVAVPAFLLGRTEVTQGQWKAVIGRNPSHFKRCGDDCPVESVSWHDVQAFVRKLSQATGRPYRLPSEAEWEYAARAGTTTAFSTGFTVTAAQANFNGTGTYDGSAPGAYRRAPLPVGSFEPNAFGLCDMHGNVWEWVQDRYHRSYYGAPADAGAWEPADHGPRRVLRGGSWADAPEALRSAFRGVLAPEVRLSGVGFRIARDE
jgi:formylglycine-generating enzyme required for sulfatase activity